MCALRAVTIEAPNEVSPAPPDDDAALGAFAAASFCAPFELSGTFVGGRLDLSAPAGGQVTADQAACIGTGLVERLGPDRVREFGLGTYPWGTLDFGLRTNRLPTPVGQTEAETIVDTFRACTPAWEALLIMSVTEGADELTIEEAACVADQLDDTVARDAFIAEIDGPTTTRHWTMPPPWRRRPPR